MNTEKMAVAAIKTILANCKDKPSKSDWKAMMEIAKSHAKGYVETIERDPEYHVRHGKTKPVTGESGGRKTK